MNQHQQQLKYSSYPDSRYSQSVAGLFGFMFLRVRGKVGYFQLVVEDQIKDLEGLTMRASKIDRTMFFKLRMQLKTD